MNGALLTNRSAVDRNTTDYYRTPPDVTEALLRFLEGQEDLLMPHHTIWEPACGTGEMAEVMRGKGYGVTASDLYPSDYTEGGSDFFTTERTCDWIITNPPFSQVEKFIRRALELGKPCAFLLKSQFWHAKSRLQLFREWPPTFVLPLTWRPDFLWGAKSGSPTMECIWTVWLGYGWRTDYVPLERPTE